MRNQMQTFGSTRRDSVFQEGIRMLRQLTLAHLRASAVAAACQHTHGCALPRAPRGRWRAPQPRRSAPPSPPSGTRKTQSRLVGREQIEFVAERFLGCPTHASASRSTHHHDHAHAAEHTGARGKPPARNQSKFGLNGEDTSVLMIVSGCRCGCLVCIHCSHASRASSPACP